MADPDPAPAAAARAPRWQALRAELLCALELAGLTGLAFTRPVLDSFGRSPETFLVRGATPGDVLVFALLVATVPLAALGAVGAAARLAGRQPRAAVHLALIGLLSGVTAWRIGTDIGSAGPLILVLAGVMAVGVTAVRWRAPSTATYLRYLGAASLIFLGQFLVLSPSSSLVLGDGGSPAGAAERRAVQGGDGDPPPVVMVVLDALPTANLLDGAGRIDAELYPNLAGLADESTWYRNHSTTSAWTWQAVPALLTGNMWTGGMPDVENNPRNLFTLFAGTHDVTATEQITRLCPAEVCPPDDDDAVPELLGDAVDWWTGALETEAEGGAQMLPGALEPDRAEEFVDWIDAQDFTPGGDPGLWFYHLIMPHDPWVLLDDMTPYASVAEEPYGLFLHAFWGEVGTDVARQRAILQTQAVDRALGHLLDRLREDRAFDETTIVVTGDHGEAFAPNRPLRGMAAEQYEQVAWTPFIVKAPGQREGVIDDSNVLNVDVLPTLAATLGIDLPWEVDGVAAAEADRARPDGAKAALVADNHEIQPRDGETHLTLDGVEGLARLLRTDPVPGEGEHAVWQRTRYGGLVGRSVDDLAVEYDRVGSLPVEQLDRIEHPGDEPPLLEVLAETQLAPGEVVAITVNGVVSAVAPVVQLSSSDPAAGQVVHALLMPDAFEADNDVTAYLVDGGPGAETLHLLTVLPG